MKLTIGDSAWWEYNEHKKNLFQMETTGRDSRYMASASDRNADGVYWSVRATLSRLNVGGKHEGKLEVEWKRPMKDSIMREFVLDQNQVQELISGVKPSDSDPYKAFKFLMDYANKLLENKP